MTTILACTDLSEASDHALREADEWARRRDAKLVVTHVLPQWPVSQALLGLLGSDSNKRWEQFLRLSEQRVIDQITRTIKHASGDYELVIAEGTPHLEILKVAKAKAAKLIVLAASNKPGVERVLLGSTAEKVLRYADEAVLVSRQSPSGGVVMAASDLSDLAVPAVEAAVVEAARLGAPLSLVFCLDIARPFTATFNPAVIIDDKTQVAMREAANETLQATLARFDAKGSTRVLDGDPKRRLPELAQAEQAQLLVVGTHGDSGVARFLLGSVAQAVVRRAPCSVLVVRQ